MKEKLVVEMFKDKIREHYNRTLRIGVQCNCKTSNVFTELKEFSDKIGADYSIVQQLCYDIKEEMYNQFYDKNYRYRTLGNRTLSSKDVVHRNMVKRNNEYSKRIIKRNGGVV